MANRVVEESNLTVVADAIRQKGATEDLLEFPDGFVAAVDALKIAGAPDPAVLTMTNNQSYTFLYKYYTNGATAWKSGTGGVGGTYNLNLKVGDVVVLLMQTNKTSSTTTTTYKTNYELTGGVGLSYTVTRASTNNTTYYYYFYFVVITEEKATVRIYTP